MFSAYHFHCGLVNCEYAIQKELALATQKNSGKDTEKSTPPKKNGMKTQAAKTMTSGMKMLPKPSKKQAEESRIKGPIL